jgi:hypothetical protein
MYLPWCHNSTDYGTKLRLPTLGLAPQGLRQQPKVVQGIAMLLRLPSGSAAGQSAAAGVADVIVGR